MNKKQFIILLILLLAIALFFVFDLKQFFDLAYIKSQQTTLSIYYQEHLWTTVLIFFIVYVLVTGLSLPGAAILTLLAGAIFGLWVGTLLISFASSIGASLAFLSSRFILRDMVQKKFAQHLQAINQGVEKDGSFYLFTLRLVPVFPFFLINLLMGLTPISLLKFYIVSQLGMLLGTIVFINAGTQLAKLDSLSGILSLPIIASFVLLGLFPLLAKKFIDYVNPRLGKNKAS